MVHGVGGVGGWDLVICIKDTELGRILKRMHLKAELEEETAQGPDVCLFIDWLVAVEINHLRGSVHWSSVALDLYAREGGRVMEQREREREER